MASESADAGSTDNLTMNARFALLAAVLTATACGDATPGISLEASAKTAEADGTSQITLTANVVPLDGVVTFAGGPGVLSASQVQAVDGVASIVVFAPRENEIEGEIGGAAVFTAETITQQGAVKGSVNVDFTHPTVGAPVLRLSGPTTAIDAGSGTESTLTLLGFRLTDRVVHLSASAAGITLPETVELDDNGDGSFSKELTVVAPAEPVTIVVTATIGDVSDTTSLRYIGAGESRFDLSGDFAQLTWGTVELSEFEPFIPGTACVIAKTINLVHVEQAGETLHVTSTQCVVTMPGIPIAGSVITPTPGPGFIAASNAAGEGQSLDFDITYDGADGRWEVPVSEFEAVTVGADPDVELTDDVSHQIDADGDGEDGVTVNTTAGPQHTAFRTILKQMTADIIDNNEITGKPRDGDGVLADTKTVIYGGQFGGFGPKIRPILSKWQLKRVDGRHDSQNIAGNDNDASSLSCADVAAFAAQMELTFESPDPDLACR